jgi:hypothetical protein
MVRGSVSKQILELRRVFGLFGYLLVVWGFYRLIFKLPDNVEEAVLKPVLWLGPVLWLVLVAEKRKLSDIGWTGKNLFSGIGWGVVLGVIFAGEGVMVNWMRYGQINFQNILAGGGLSGVMWIPLLTAISEETVFRGYILSRLSEVIKSSYWPLVISSLMFVTVYLPMSFFILHYSGAQMVAYFFLVFVLGMGGGWVYMRSKSLAAPIIVHTLWSWVILLFR